MPTKIFDINSPSSFDPNKIEVVGNKYQLKLIDNPNQDFIQDFDNDVGFIYDNTKTEFVGGTVRQIDQRPPNAIFYGNFKDLNSKNNPEDGNWGDGNLIGTLNGNASISNNELDLTGSNANVEYNPDNLATMIQQGCVRIRWKPNYIGSATTTQVLFQSSPNTTDRLLIRHSGSQIQVYGFCAGIQAMSMVFTWTPTIIKYYELEINFDYTGGTHRTFIDGILEDTDSGTGIRSGNTLFRIGASTGMDCYIDDILFFDNVQHTANYTPDWGSIKDTIYLGDIITLPEMRYTGVGTLISFDSFLTVEIDSPRYTLQIGQSGDYLYWNGLAWIVSDNTYDQANNTITFNANTGSLDILGEIFEQFRLYTTDSNVLTSVDTLTASLTAQTYPTDNPSITFSEIIKMDGLESITEIKNIVGNDEIKAIQSKDTIPYYFDVTWQLSDDTYLESNTIDEIETNKATFTTIGINYTLKIFLHSEDGLTTPQWESVTVDYNFSPLDPEIVDKTILWWNSQQTDADNDTQNATLILKNDVIKYKNRTVLRRERYAIIPIDGQYEKAIADTENMEVDNIGREQRYILQIGKKVFNLNIPNIINTDDGSVNLYDDGIIQID